MKKPFVIKRVKRKLMKVIGYFLKKIISKKLSKEEVRNELIKKFGTFTLLNSRDYKEYEEKLRSGSNALPFFLFVGFGIYALYTSKTKKPPVLFDLEDVENFHQVEQFIEQTVEEKLNEKGFFFFLKNSIKNFYFYPVINLGELIWKILLISCLSVLLRWSISFCLMKWKNLTLTRKKEEKKEKEEKS